MTTKESCRILVVEDEESILAGLEHALQAEGYEVVVAQDGRAALTCLNESSFDLVLLDVMLPHRSGFDVLTEVRRRGRDLPVILLTARNQEVDKVRGLDLGADDYVTKPFSLAELLARIRARLRGSERSQTDIPDVLQLGAIRIDLPRLRIEHNGTCCDLSVREREMLTLLWRERGKAVTRSRFLDEVWGHDAFPTTRTIDQHVARLRQKVEVEPKKPRYLHTVFGVGYRLDL